MGIIITFGCITQKIFGDRIYFRTPLISIYLFIKTAQILKFLRSGGQIYGQKTQYKIPWLKIRLENKIQHYFK